jgi:HSP20 family protein
MAKKEKSSFFGKIMGGSAAENLPAQVVVSQQNQAVLEAEELAEEDDIVEETIVEEEITETPVKEKAGEDWLNDYEGQLNIDMFQTKDNVIIKSTIAGVRPEDIDITVANDMITIKGSRKKEENINQDDYFYQECYWGNFSRSVIIPVDIDSENIEADLKDGILTVIVPKAAKAKTKKVKVKGL